MPIRRSEVWFQTDGKGLPEMNVGSLESVHAWHLICNALFAAGWDGKVKKNESGVESAMRFIERLAHERQNDDQLG